MKNLLLLFWVLSLFGCSTIKRYSGPELPSEKVATIALKAPPTSFIPVFWVFPLNMLNWLADDWFETSWTNAIITAEDVELDRFTAVNVLPGNGVVKLEHFFILTKRLCQIQLSPDAGQRYEAFIRNGYLKIYDLNRNRTLDADCEVSTFK